MHTRDTPCCRSCGAPLTETFVDLGMSPLANSYVAPGRAAAMEPFYPLHAYVCSSCFLVQLDEFEKPDHIFSDYLYFSSFSTSWLDHASRYVAAITERLGLGAGSKVVEIASNDGYLLQYFVARGVPVLGVDPARNVVAEAEKRGVPTEVAFFGRETADRLVAAGHRADLMIANNVLAHVPDINDFVGGFARLLAPGGTATFEFPHLLTLIRDRQFDTIYHEHFSYLSLLALEPVFARAGLEVYDVEQLPTHGGSLRLFVRHRDAGRPVGAAVDALRREEAAAGLGDIAAYRAFRRSISDLRYEILEFFVAANRAGKTMCAYGAPAKGNTLLNYVGVKPDMIPFTVDRNDHKQGHLLPGTRIPILHPDAIARARPDYVVILPWNLKAEIMAQLAEIRVWGGRFVTFVPGVEVS